MLAILTPALLFSAFLLLLLISLSIPIIKTIYLFKLSANVGSSLLNTGASGSVKFGVWGYCISSIDISVVGFDHSTTAHCSKNHLGYTFDKTIADALHITDAQNTISRATTAALVLHPIAAGLTFLALLISLFMLCRGSNGTARLPSFLTLIAGLLSAIVTTIVFLVDVIFVAVVKHKVRDATDGNLSLDWGNAVWMALGATVALWLATIGACTGICSLRSRRRNAKTQRY